MEFVCKDPKATVRAANVRSTLDAFKLLPGLGRKIIEKHNLKIENLQENLVIPVQAWLDALKEIQTNVGPAKVREVGRNVVLNADFPPTFPDVESILVALDAIYYMNHTGSVGHYVVTQKESGIEIGCETPYPRMFEYGLIEGICQNRNVGGQFSVEYVPGSADEERTCTLFVKRV